MKNIIKQLKKNQLGAFAVEYALLAPLFITFSFGCLEIGRIMLVYASLEGAVTESTRIAITGNVPDGYANTEEYIREYVQNSLKDIGVGSGVTLSMNVYDSFSDIGEAEPFTDLNSNLIYDVGECYTDVNDNSTWDADMGATGTGGEENIMVMELTVDLPYLMYGVISAFSGSETIELTATTAVRNEPYGGIAWTPSSNVICT